MTSARSLRQRFGLAAGMAGMSILLTASTTEQAMGAPPPQHLPAHPDQACTTSNRSVKQLAIIDSTSEGGFQCLGVAVEGGTVRAVRLERHNFVSQPGQPGSEQIKVVEYPAAAVDSGSGAVIDGIPGHDAIVLRGRLSASPGKAELVLSYLFNGLTGEFHSCPVTLDSTPRTGWRLINRYDQTISHIVVKIRQVPVFGTVGIDNLEGACTLRDRQAGATVVPTPSATPQDPCATGEPAGSRRVCANPGSGSFASGP